MNDSPLPSVFRFLFSSSLRFLCQSLYFWGAEGTEAHRFVLRSFLDLWELSCSRIERSLALGPISWVIFCHASVCVAVPLAPQILLSAFVGSKNPLNRGPDSRDD